MAGGQGSRGTEALRKLFAGFCSAYWTNIYRILVFHFISVKACSVLYSPRVSYVLFDAGTAYYNTL